ncbi:MAG: hypothetical protein JW727_03150 [Candidatus Aenigmarchaeota archaeon]|nr:hypothetical protein [Candidatus Aenigmarchaeota archaeon]
MVSPESGSSSSGRHRLYSADILEKAPTVRARTFELAGLYTLKETYLNAGIQDSTLDRTLSDLEKQLRGYSVPGGPDLVAIAKDMHFYGIIEPEKPKVVSGNFSEAEASVPEEKKLWENYQSRYKGAMLPKEERLIARQEELLARARSSPDIQAYILLETQLNALQSQGKGFGADNLPLSEEAKIVASRFGEFIRNIESSDPEGKRSGALKQFLYEKDALAKDWETYGQAKVELAKHYGFDSIGKLAEMEARYGNDSEMLQKMGALRGRLQAMVEGPNPAPESVPTPPQPPAPIQQMPAASAPREAPPAQQLAYQSNFQKRMEGGLQK